MTDASLWSSATARPVDLGEFCVSRGVNVISARQVKAARAALDLSAKRLAKKSGVSESSIRRAERESDATVTLDLLVRLQTYFQDEGISFFWSDTEAGVKWKRSANSTRG